MITLRIRPRTHPRTGRTLWNGCSRSSVGDGRCAAPERQGARQRPRVQVQPRGDPTGGARSGSEHLAAERVPSRRAAHRGAAGAIARRAWQRSWAGRHAGWCRCRFRSDQCLVLGMDRMKVRRVVICEVHVDRDSVELAEARHRLTQDLATTRSLDRTTRNEQPTPLFPGGIAQPPDPVPNPVAPEEPKHQFKQAVRITPSGNPVAARTRKRKEPLRRVALTWYFLGSPYGIRTRAATLRGRLGPSGSCCLMPICMV